MDPDQTANTVAALFGPLKGIGRPSFYANWCVSI